MPQKDTPLLSATVSDGPDSVACPTELVSHETKDSQIISIQESTSDEKSDNAMEFSPSTNEICELEKP